jgi:hypothetical protein
MSGRGPGSSGLDIAPDRYPICLVKKKGEVPFQKDHDFRIRRYDFSAPEEHQQPKKTVESASPQSMKGRDFLAGECGDSPGKAKRPLEGGWRIL